MLPRVALEYGHVWSAGSTRAWATSRSKPGRLTSCRAANCSSRFLPTRLLSSWPTRRCSAYFSRPRTGPQNRGHRVPQVLGMMQKSASNALRNDLTPNDTQQHHRSSMITFIKHALSASAEADIEIAGWIRSRRDAKDFSFLEVNDGSCLRNLQVIVDREVPGYEQALHATTGSSVRVAGRLLASPAAGQKWELRATHVEIIGGAELREVPGYEQALHATTGSSVRVAGRLLASPAAGQKWELRATHVEIIGGA